MFKNPFLLPLPVAILARRALVMLFLALCHADLELGAAFVPMEVERYEGKALALNSSNQTVELLPVQK